MRRAINGIFARVTVPFVFALALAALCAGVASMPTLAFAHEEAGESSVAIAALPQDLSPWGMFLNADIVVKAVMIGLAFASLVTWTVWVAKEHRALARAPPCAGACASSTRRQRSPRRMKSAQRHRTVAQLMQAAGSEIRLSANLRGDGFKERIAWQLERIEMASGGKISRGTGMLATIGATAPFVGLFGTVWGIINSFIGISNAHTTNLAVVAPGIAEALLATALGLVAAIPAVMIYNVLARSTAHTARWSAMRRRRSCSSSAAISTAPAAQSAASLTSSASRGVAMAVRLDHGTDDLEIPRDQRHAVHRRHAGAADHLHGGGAARDGRHRRRPSRLDAEPHAAGQAALPHHQARPHARVGESPVARDQLASALDSRDRRIRTIAFSCAPTSVTYSDLMEVMNELRAARYLKVALVGLETRNRNDRSHALSWHRR